MGLLSKKFGLIMGLANDHSIAWGSARHCTRRGPNWPSRTSPACPTNAACETSSAQGREDDLPLRRAKRRGHHPHLRHGEGTYGRLDSLVHSIAFAPPQELRNPYVSMSRAGWHLAMDISVFSLVAVCRAAMPIMTTGGSILTISYYGGEKVVPGYNMMGVCKSALEHSVRYLAWDLGQQNYVRVNAISAGPMRTLSSAGISHFDKCGSTPRRRPPWAATWSSTTSATRASTCSAIFPAASPAKCCTSIADIISSGCRLSHDRSYR